MTYYKHQYFSIIIIILLEILRYLIKILNDNWENLSISALILQNIRGLCDSIFFGYNKALIEYKFFSPYKCCYIFGFINTAIIIILYLIVSHISFKEANSFCSLKYNDSYYFDNFYSIFKNINITQIFTFLLYIICNGIYQVLINITISEFTACHLFIPLQLIQFTFNIYESISNWKLLLFIIICTSFEMIFIFIFLEIIILNCFGLNKNIKKYIINRANEDYSIEEITDRSNSEEVINDNYVYSTNFEEENNVLSEMKNKGNNLEKC
jgi:hypothetical protein